MALGRLGFGRDEWRTFLLLVAGHLLFVAALFVRGGFLGNLQIHVSIALFGLPLLLFGQRDRIVARGLVLLIGFSLVHYCAFKLAQTSFRVPFSGEGLTDSPWVPGAIGGAVGAAGAFALCALAGLLRPGVRGLLLAGTLALVVIGSAGVRIGVFGESARDEMPWGLLWVYVPWQLVFAYLLAKVLRVERSPTA